MYLSNWGELSPDVDGGGFPSYFVSRKNYNKFCEYKNMYIINEGKNKLSEKILISK